MKNGNNLGFTVFASFGAYYFSYATTMTPAFGLEAAYSNTDEYNNAIAILFLCWSFLFLLFVIVGIRTNLVLVGIFVSVTLTAVFVSASHFVAAKHQDTIAATFEKVRYSVSTHFYLVQEADKFKTAGTCLMIGAIAGWYFVAHLLIKDQGFTFELPRGDLRPTVVVQVSYEQASYQHFFYSRRTDRL